MVTSHHGLFRFTRIPFGLEIASRTLQRAMEVTLRNVKRQFVLVHLYDILRSLQMPDDQVEHVGQVLRLMNDVDVPLNLKK